VQTPQAEYTRFERARIIGARALQVRMGAPILIEASPDMIDPVEVALLEYEKAVIPLTIHRPK
jgi:DNA-directed RNA polymerase subunit K